MLPDPEFATQWDAVIVEIAQEPAAFASDFEFALRKKVDRALVPLHWLIVLHGPSGTGKISLARGLASRTAEAVSVIVRFRYIEVEPHALASAVRT